ncbi:MAG: hypothetical protein IKJ84_05495 [Oscillospiraceae bacterium]|nr:hypothetical protein [Oscillospiraceae bacterium]
MLSRTRRILSLLLAAAMLLAGCASPASSAPQAVAQASYPEMAPYPDESSFINKLTGEFDDEGFSQVYDAWREDRSRQRSQPEGYADSLTPFFSESIPAVLSSDTGNPVCSPLNIYLALALLAESTGGTSQEQILSALNAPDIASLRTQAGQVWNAHYSADGATVSLLANSLWLDQDLTYRQDTVDLLARQYYASVFQGDLGSSAMNEALQTWINQQTGGLLEQQSQNLEMSPDTVLALASTILYQAKWHTEFREENSEPSIFHAPGGDTQVTFMKDQLTYGPYYWGTDFAAISLSIEGSGRMWLVLPDEGKTPEDVLSGGLALDMILGSPYDYPDQASIRVNLSLPKFDITSDLRLEESLQALGITEVFDPASADFSAILPDQPAWLDKVQHAARVMIDEEGISAAAYTAMMVAGAALPPEDEVDFILDRPFLFVITSHDNLPLFAGIVNTP